MKAGLVKQVFISVDLVSVHVKLVLFQISQKIGVLIYYGLCENSEILPFTF